MERPFRTTIRVHIRRQLNLDPDLEAVEPTETTELISSYTIDRSSLSPEAQVAFACLDENGSRATLHTANLIAPIPAIDDLVHMHVATVNRQDPNYYNLFGGSLTIVVPHHSLSTTTSALLS
jgi:hypothetical protein